MALTPSTMRPLDTPAPDFALPDPNGRVWRLRDFEDAPALLVMFLCNHCPYVKHIRSELAAFVRKNQDRGLAAVAINSNDVEKHPDDAPALMKEEQGRHRETFSYLFDESQEVAKAYTAACTPDFFLFDERRRLVYRGQFDGSRPGSEVPVTGADLQAAVDAVFAGQRIDPNQRPSMGCNIKWRPGNEPPYFG